MSLDEDAGADPAEPSIDGNLISDGPDSSSPTDVPTPDPGPDPPEVAAPPPVAGGLVGLSRRARAAARSEAAGAVAGVVGLGRRAGASARSGVESVGRSLAERRGQAERVVARGLASTQELIDRPRRWRAGRRDRALVAAAEKAAAQQAARAARESATEAARAARERAAEAARAARESTAEAARAAREDARQSAIEQKAAEVVAAREAEDQRTYARLVAQDRSRRRRRRRLLLALLISPILAATGVAVAALYVDSIPSPGQLALPESTTVYFADGVTPMAQLGTVNRTILSYDQMNDAVKQSIVAAEDRTFWSNRGVDLASVARAAWNNLRGGSLQGASTITEQYVRIAAGLTGITYARKTREAVLAWRMDHTYSKEKILEFYLNEVPFGRGAYGIEAAAQAYFGKTARRTAPAAQQVTVAEAMVLAALVKQPEPNPADPVDEPGYDPARGGIAAANAMMRWQYVRDGMVSLGYLSATQAASLQFPHTVLALDANADQDGMSGPTGLVVDHVLSELRQSPPFKGEPADYIRDGGFRIVTTVDKRAQDAAEAAADITRVTAPVNERGQPADWQAALVAVEPGTGRVLAYYGGNSGTGADYAGWYTDAAGNAVGYGEHRPGSSFKVYDLAEALRQGVSLTSTWDSPAVKQFPADGRTNGSPAGPVRNSSTDPCQPRCTLVQATIASLNVPFFDLTEQIGAGNVIDMAHRAGIDSMWTDRAGTNAPVRVDLQGHTGQELVTGSSAAKSLFTTEVGIGQYGVTVLDHANGMATFAAGGQRADAHFVRAVYQHGSLVYAEQLVQSNIGISADQVNALTNVLTQVPSAKLSNGWEAAGKTGTWEAADPPTANADVWMVGYTRSLAAAVWLGTKDGKALTKTNGSQEVYGSTDAAPIWRQFMMDATAAMGLDSRNENFPAAAVAASASASPAPSR